MRGAASLVALSWLALVGAGAVPPPAGLPPAPPRPAAPLAPAAAEPQVTLAELAAAIDAAAGEPDGERVVLGHLSRKLGVPADTLRAERTKTGLGWGDLLIADRLSLETHVPLDVLVAEMRGGRTWESIARERGADLERLASDVRASEDAVEQHSEDKSPHATATPGPSGRSRGAGGGGRGHGRRGY
jgi:hypothetical protein